MSQVWIFVVRSAKVTLWLRYERPADIAGEDWRRTYHDEKRNHVFAAARNLSLEPCPTITAGGLAMVGIDRYWLEWEDDGVAG